MLSHAALSGQLPGIVIFPLHSGFESTAGKGLIQQWLIQKYIYSWKSRREEQDSEIYEGWIVLPPGLTHSSNIPLPCSSLLSFVIKSIHLSFRTGIYAFNSFHLL